MVIQIEAKDQKSFKKHPKRKMFSKDQKMDHLGKALFKSLEYINKIEKAGITLPVDDYDRESIERIKNPLDKLGIAVFFVDPDDQKVELRGNLPE
jgi:hypothetical protein